MAGGIIGGILGEGFAARRHFKALRRRRQNRSKWSCSKGKIDMRYLPACWLHSASLPAPSTPLTRTANNSALRKATGQQTRHAKSRGLCVVFEGALLFDKQTLSDLKTAVSYFNQAIAKDPGYALAYADLARPMPYCLTTGIVLSKISRSRLPSPARQWSWTPPWPVPHALLGGTMMAHEWDFAGGEAEFKKGLELDPNDAHAHELYADNMSTIGGREQEALAEINRAHQLDPLSLAISVEVGTVYIGARRFDEAIVAARKWQMRTRHSPRRTPV